HNKAAIIPIHTMINELLSYVFNSKRQSTHQLKFADICCLLHVLGLFENEYISSLKLISTNIEQFIVHKNETMLDKNVIEEYLKPTLIPCLLKIWKCRSDSFSYSK
ncbi:unnamed protein product, partial [Didymodactylos carnosus]